MRLFLLFCFFTLGNRFEIIVYSIEPYLFYERYNNGRYSLVLNFRRSGPLNRYLFFYCHCAGRFVYFWRLVITSKNDDFPKFFHSNRNMTRERAYVFTIIVVSSIMRRKKTKILCTRNKSFLLFLKKNKNCISTSTVVF